MKKSSVKVLFVCLGNICRSPSAQAVFEAQVKEAGLEQHIQVDSCGTAGYHIDEAPDSRATYAAQLRGYKMTHLRGRKISQEDFRIFDYILVMDRDNLTSVQALLPIDSKSNVSLFREFDTQADSLEVPDPYYGGKEGFETVLDLIESAAKGLLGSIQLKHFN